jgi:hypothetical protein
MKLTLKLIALLAVTAAIVLPRGTAHDRVLLLVLEGARGDVVRALARAGHLPTLESVIAGGVGGDISGVAETSSADQLLSRILSVPVTGDPGRTERRTPLWELLSRQMRPFVLSGVPGVDADVTGGGISLPGPDAATGFIGINAGLVVNRRTIERDAVTWPYATVAADLRSAAAAATSGGGAEWVRWRDSSGSDSRVGAFAVYRLDDETVYLSPVYTRIVDDVTMPGLLAGTLYVGDDPTRVVLSSRVAEYLPRHATELAEARAATAMAITDARPWELLVHVDRRIAIIEAAVARRTGHEEAASATDEGPPAVLLDAYKAVDSMVARWLELAGARTAVLVIGLTEQPPVRGEPVGWFAVASVVGDLGSWGPVTADDLGGTLAYLLSFDAGAGRTPLSAIAARFPLRSRFQVRSFLDGRAVASVPADARALQDLLKSDAAERR